MRLKTNLKKATWIWIGRVAALIGIPSGLIAIYVLFYPPQSGDCSLLRSQRAQAQTEVQSAQGQLADAQSKVAHLEDVVDYLASYIDRVTLTDDQLETRRVELDRELRQLALYRDRVSTVTDRVSDAQSSYNRLDAEYRGRECKE